MTEKHYPTDDGGQLDAGARVVQAKPCAKRIAHGHVLAVSLVAWCELPDGHGGACSGPVPWPHSLLPPPGKVK